MNFMTPFGLQVDLQVGSISGPIKKTERRLTQLRNIFADQVAADRILEAEGDRLIYEVYAADLPEEAGQVLYCTTVIHPGMVGNEYHMTKGHFHTKRDCGEVYLGLAGEGYLVLQLEDGTVKNVPMKPGTAAYVPPFYAHRTVNTGGVPFVFFAAWPGDAGHDYGTIEHTGFGKLLLNHKGQPEFVVNPRYVQSSNQS